MDPRHVRFICWGNEYSDLVGLVSNIPDGTFGDLDKRGIGVSSTSSKGGSREGCVVYPLKGSIDLDSVKIPEGAEVQRKKIDGVDAIVMDYKEGFYVVYNYRRI